MSGIIIGLTGSFGSGCTTIARRFIEPQGFNYISLSQILKDSFKEEFKREHSQRRELQLYGNKIREEKGSDYLARCTYSYIEKTSDVNWVVDGFKNPAEVEYFRNKHSDFYLIGVFADFNTRWERVRNKYHNESQAIFRVDDEIDSNDELVHGQRVKDCFLISDIIVSNNINFHFDSEDEAKYKNYINSFIKLITKENLRAPTAEETLMATAYASSLRSSCSKRKVGAIIVDDYNNIFSSGHNDVPKNERPCINEHGQCYRDKIRGSVKEDINNLIPDDDLNSKVKKAISKYKMLDLCRALHAEEQAILNVARIGASAIFHKSTLYTTTYPCNLCANKIVQVGIPKIVYLEPYPVKEAKEILDKQKVKQKPFDGVSFKGFFKLFGREVL